jgi:hypothetical protein
VADTRTRRRADRRDCARIQNCRTYLFPPLTTSNDLS